MADIKDLLLSSGETVYALNCFKRIYDLDKDDPTRQLELEEFNKPLQETFTALSHIGGYSFSYKSDVDTTPTYSPPAKKIAPSQPYQPKRDEDGDIKDE